MKAHKYLNDFGQEWEVCCFADKNPGTKQRNIPESPPNHWAFISGPREGPPREARAQQRSPSTAQIRAEKRIFLLSHHRTFNLHREILFACCRLITGSCLGSPRPLISVELSNT